MTATKIVKGIVCFFTIFPEVGEKRLSNFIQRSNDRRLLESAIRPFASARKFFGDVVRKIVRLPEHVWEKPHFCANYGIRIKYIKEDPAGKIDEPEKARSFKA